MKAKKAVENCAFDCGLASQCNGSMPQFFTLTIMIASRCLRPLVSDRGLCACSEKNIPIQWAGITLPS